MQELQKEVTSKGGVWLLVNSTNKRNSGYRTSDAAKAEWDKQKMQATAWLDDNSGTIGKAYDMKTTPHMYLIDASGTLIYNGAIDNKAASSGDPRAAKNYVKETFAKLQAGEKVEPFETKPYGCGVKY
jgi:hypothetical protein